MSTQSYSKNLQKLKISSTKISPFNFYNGYRADSVPLTEERLKFQIVKYPYHKSRDDIVIPNLRKPQIETKFSSNKKNPQVRLFNSTTTVNKYANSPFSKKQKSQLNLISATYLQTRSKGNTSNLSTYSGPSSSTQRIQIQRYSDNYRNGYLARMKSYHENYKENLKRIDEKVNPNPKPKARPKQLLFVSRLPDVPEYDELGDIDDFDLDKFKTINREAYIRFKRMYDHLNSLEKEVDEFDFEIDALDDLNHHDKISRFRAFILYLRKLFKLEKVSHEKEAFTLDSNENYNIDNEMAEFKRTINVYKTNYTKFNKMLKRFSVPMNTAPKFQSNLVSEKTSGKVLIENIDSESRENSEEPFDRYSNEENDSIKSTDESLVTFEHLLKKHREIDELFEKDRFIFDF